MLESLEAERDAEAVHDAFVGWLEKPHGPRPFFAWVHLYDPHAPYTPPEPYKSQFPKNPYAGEIAYVDAVVGKVVDALESRGLLESTLVAVVGDHGEGLGDHEERTHSLLIYNSTLHVPMLIQAPGLVPAGRTIDDLTRTIDLAPTLLDYLGFPRPLGQGTSLRPRIEGRPPKEEILAYSESLYPELNLGWSALHGLETSQYRFILAPRRELYDLDLDPEEREDLSDARPSITRRLQRRLEELTEAVASPETQAGTEMDPETQARLRSLGYASAPSRDRPAKRGSLVDPKDKLAAWNQIQLAVFQFGRGDYAGALGVLTHVLDSEKDIPMIYEYLGSCHVRLEQWPEASQVYREALEHGIESADFHLNLGLIHFHDGKLVEAERELRAALTLDALSVPAHYRLADVHRAAGDHAKAIEHYQKALDINPSHVYAWNGLGMTLSRDGRDQDALEAFREVIRLHPEGARGHFNLAVQLERMRQDELAEAAYRSFLNLSAPSAERYPRERERATLAIRRLGGTAQ